MPFNITSAKLTGNPDISGWVQAYEFKPEDPEKISKRGHLYSIVCSKNATEGIESVVEGREILARFHEEYFGQIEDDAYQALKNAVEKVVSEFWGNVELAACVVLNEVIYIAAAGGAGIYILRDGEITPLIKSDSMVITASGYPKINDKYIIGTSAFFEQFGYGILKASMSGKDPKETVESLAPGLHMQKSSGLMGTLLIFFESQQEKDLFMPSKIENPQEELQFPSSQISAALPAEDRKPNFFDRVRSIKIKTTKEYEATRSPKKKISITVGIVLLFILFMSIFFGVRKKQEMDFKAQYSERLSQAKHGVEEAQSLLSLNPERSRELFIGARSQVLGLMSEDIADPELEALRLKIEENEKVILGEYKDNPQLFSDLILVSKGFSADELVASDDNIFVIDKQGKKLLKVNVRTGRSEIVAGPAQINEVGSITA